MIRNYDQGIRDRVVAALVAGGKTQAEAEELEATNHTAIVGEFKGFRAAREDVFQYGMQTAGAEAEACNMAFTDLVAWASANLLP